MTCIVTPPRRTLCLVALVSVAFSFSRAEASTPGADAFLLLPVTAREIGLGQATVALVNDVTAFHWNPGGLGMIKSFEAAASYSRLYQGLASHQMVAAGIPFRSTLRLGISWVRLGVDDIPIYPSLEGYGTPNERSVHAQQGAIGSFAYAENAFFLTLARYHSLQIDLGWQYLTLPMELPVGITLKYLTISAGDTLSGSGIGVDAGVQSRFSLGRVLDNRLLGTISFGVTLADIGRTRITWDTPSKHADDQSMKLHYGAAYEQPLPFVKSAAILAVAKTKYGLTWGVEYTFMEQVSLRMGKDMIAENSLSFGAGFSWRGVRLDYALQRHELGATHRVSVLYAY